MTSAPWLPRRSVVVAVMLTIASGAMPAAHVGSPDVFVDAYAGPYRLLITVRPPYAIPGVADVEVQAADASAAPRAHGSRRPPIARCHRPIIPDGSPDISG